MAHIFSTIDTCPVAPRVTSQPTDRLSPRARAQKAQGGWDGVLGGYIGGYMDTI